MTVRAETGKKTAGDHVVQRTTALIGAIRPQIVIRGSRNGADPPGGARDRGACVERAPPV